MVSDGLFHAWPWQFDYSERESILAIYWMDPDIAQLFGTARDTALTPARAPEQQAFTYESS